MPLELVPAVHAFPDIFVVDGVRVFGCHFDAAVGECRGAFLCPMVTRRLVPDKQI